jgi:prolyl-tRNA synthetase
MVHLCALTESAMSMADTLYEELTSSGVEVLFDDRLERAGAQFADADLIGAPFRLVVSSRSIQAGGIEVKRREDEAPSVIPGEQVGAWLREQIASR